MSKVQQGFECAAAATARRARDENMKPLLQSHFHIKSKQQREGKGLRGQTVNTMRHRLWFIMHTANVVIAIGRLDTWCMQKEGTEHREANKKPIRISHSEQALRQINILAHNNKRARESGTGKRGRAETEADASARQKAVGFTKRG